MSVEDAADDRDPLLFSGTLRSNLDPFNVYPDQKLWDASRRAHLLDSEVERFTLEMAIEEEGNNLSVGRGFLNEMMS